MKYKGLGSPVNEQLERSGRVGIPARTREGPELGDIKVKRGGLGGGNVFSESGTLPARALWHGDMLANIYLDLVYSMS